MIDDQIIVNDINYGSIVFDANQVMPDDFILLKQDRYPTYHFANVVDDYYMEITDVVRGEVIIYFEMVSIFRNGYRQHQNI